MLVELRKNLKKSLRPLFINDLAEALIIHVILNT